MFATYLPRFYDSGRQMPNRPIGVYKTLYGARQASKAKKLAVGRLIPEHTCWHHSGISPARRAMDPACHGEVEFFCRDAEVEAL